jgi:hypothetical protein
MNVNQCWLDSCSGDNSAAGHAGQGRFAADPASTVASVGFRNWMFRAPQNRADGRHQKGVA